MNKEGPGFLYKVYSILEHSDYDDIVSWNDNGDGFQVKDINIFQNDILPNYFKHSNFASFVRQLNMYDFHKTEKNSFKHKLFKRNQKELLPQIKRKVNDQIIILPNIEQINQDLSMLTLRNQELESLFTYIIQQSDKLKRRMPFYGKNQLRQNKNDHQQEKLFDWLTNNITAESLFKILEKALLKGISLNWQRESLDKISKIKIKKTISFELSYHYDIFQNTEHEVILMPGGEAGIQTTILTFFVLSPFSTKLKYNNCFHSQSAIPHSIPYPMNIQKSPTRCQLLSKQLEL